MLKTPIFITNFKNYEQAIGQNAVKLALIHQQVAEDTGASIAVAVNPIDLQAVSEAVSIPVFAQHVDPIDFGSFTGHILPQALKRAGAIGSLLNHSERRLDPEFLTNAMACAQKASLVRVLCTESPEEAEKLIQLDPDFLAFEPPELIGSSSKSVSTEAPESIAKVVAMSSGIPIIVGAGINKPEDIKIALKLGASGFLVASSVVKSKNPAKTLKEFINAF
jgi:triosephosphate isomerase